MYPFTLSQELRQVGVIHPLVRACRQTDHQLPYLIGDLVH